MLSLFGLSTALHVGQAIKLRRRWLLPTVCICGVLELAGWAARLWSSYDPYASSPFQMQITCTIIAPTPLLAANFIILAKIIDRLGTQYSRLSPRMYTIIFTSCDVVSLVVQGVGGGIAASADDSKGAANGSHIMLGGIALQLAVIGGYSILAIEYYIRYHKDSPLPSKIGQQHFRGTFTGRLLLMSAVLAFTTLLLFIRAVYRAAELTDGWHGKIISNQVLFNVLDATMIILAMYTLNIGHPGILLRIPKSESKIKYEDVSLQALNVNGNPA